MLASQRLIPLSKTHGEAETFIQKLSIFAFNSFIGNKMCTHIFWMGDLH